MGAAKHTNRAASTLSVGINAAAVALVLPAGHGARFPALAAGEYFGLVIQNGDSDVDAREYCICTARATDTLTVTRAQEGSVAQAFSAGATVAHVILASEMDGLIQKSGDTMTGPLNYAPRVTVSINGAFVVDLAAALSNSVLVNVGGSEVVGFGTLPNGAKRTVVFQGDAIVYYNPAAILTPGLRNMLIKAGDTIELLSLGAGLWKIIGFQPADGVGSLIWDITGNTNLIGNGTGVLSTRSAIVTANGLVFNDRWRFQLQNRAASAQRIFSVSLPGFPTFHRLTSTTTAAAAANDFVFITTKIEGRDMAQAGFGAAGAAPLALSFWVRATIPGNLPVSFRNGAADRNYIAIVPVNAANTWEYKEVSIPGDVAGTWLQDNGIGLEVSFAGCAGSTFNAASVNTWGAGNLISHASATNFMATNGNTLDITATHLKLGYKAVPYVQEPHANMIARAMRYYEASEALLVMMATGAGNTLSMRIPFKVQKRANPSIGYSATATQNLSVFDARGANLNNIEWYCTAAAAGNCVWAGNWAVDAEL